MPTYEYQCHHCKKKLELFQKINDKPLKVCPSCHQETLCRGPGGGLGFQLHGSGFYQNDYAKPMEEKEKKAECCPCDKTCSKTAKS